MMSHIPDRQLSLKEVSRLLSVSERTVRNWVIQGRIKAIHPTAGFVIRVKESELKRFMAGEDMSPAKPA
jgi:excisionase family DNA binding protein